MKISLLILRLMWRASLLLKSLRQTTAATLSTLLWRKLRLTRADRQMALMEASKHNMQNKLRLHAVYSV